MTAPHNGRSGWPLERILFAMAGTATLVGVLLGVVVSPWFLALAAFAGLNQWLFVLVRRVPGLVGAAATRGRGPMRVVTRRVARRRRRSPIGAVRLGQLAGSGVNSQKAA